MEFVEVTVVVLCFYSCIVVESIEQANTSLYAKNSPSSADFLEKSTESCSLIVSPEVLTGVRKNMENIVSDGDVNLVYIHVLIQDSSWSSWRSFKKEKMLQNRIQEWQYVNKKEIFLVQLPIDIDLVTFNVLSLIGEEDEININMEVKNSSCTYDEVTVQSVKDSFWTQLFANYSNKFVLCNRHFNDKHVTYRYAIYWITTIWEGYDLNCTTKFDDRSLDVGKSGRPNIVPFVCFFLALHYVWLFAYVKFEDEQHDFHYNKESTPYSIRRFTKKFLYLKFSEGNYSHLVELPAFRMISLVFGVFLIPVSLYRILYRWEISSEEVHDYLIVLKPSEPFCSLCGSDKAAYICDIVFAMVSLISAAVFSLLSHQILAGKWTQRREEENLAEIFIKWIKRALSLGGSCCLLGRKCILLEIIQEHCYRTCFEKLENALDSEQQGSKHQPLAENASDSEPQGGEHQPLAGHGNDGVNSKGIIICKFVVRCFYFLVQLICALIFIYVFVFVLLLTGVLYLFFLLISFFIPITLYLFLPLYHFCKTTTENTCKKTFLLICFCMLHLFTQRAVVTSIIFIIRLITYFVFVALPGRITLFRYFLIFVTAVTYIFRYYFELVKIATEILDESFRTLNRIHEDNEQHAANNVTLSEEKFDAIMARLNFSHRWYLFVVKCLVVIAYIFITVEALLDGDAIKSSPHFEGFLSFLFIALSPVVIENLYKSRHGYLNDDQKQTIREVLIEPRSR